MDGRVSAGALLWENDQIKATRLGDSITGTVSGLSDPHDTDKVAFEKLW
jgi:hypothetical protein